MILPSRPQRQHRPPRRSSKPDGNRSSRAAEQVANDQERESERSARHSYINKAKQANTSQAITPNSRSRQERPRQRQRPRQRRRYLPRTRGAPQRRKQPPSVHGRRDQEHKPRQRTERVHTKLKDAAQAAPRDQQSKPHTARAADLPAPEATRSAPAQKGRQPEPHHQPRRNRRKIRSTGEHCQRAAAHTKLKAPKRQTNQEQHPKPDKISAGNIRPRTARDSAPKRYRARQQRGDTHQAESTEEAAHATTAAAYSAKPRGNATKRSPRRSYQERRTTEAPRDEIRAAARGQATSPKRRQPRRISQHKPRTADKIRTSRTTCHKISAGNLPREIPKPFIIRTTAYKYYDIIQTVSKSAICPIYRA